MGFAQTKFPGPAPGPDRKSFPFSNVNRGNPMGAIRILRIEVVLFQTADLAENAGDEQRIVFEITPP